MNYEKIYNNLINYRQQNPYQEQGHNHHIIPVKWDGSNKENNLVRLSLREHLIAHRLLLKIGKILGGVFFNSMNSAYYLMCNTGGKRFNSHGYSKAKIESAKINTIHDLGINRQDNPKEHKRLYDIQYTKNNKKKIAANKKEYAKSHKEELFEYKKKWGKEYTKRPEIRERINRQQRERRAANHEEVNNKRSDYRKLHREEINAKNREYESRPEVKERRRLARIKKKTS